MQNVLPQHHSAIPAKLLVLISILCSTIGVNAEEMSGREIMDEVGRHNESEVKLESLAMTLTDKKGRVTARTLRQYSRKNANGFYKYLLTFDSPNGIKGVALLTWEKEGGDDDQWLYLPAMGNKLKRIATGGRMNYFMGTDFAFEDLVTERRDNFNYERQADQKVAGLDVFVIDARPSNPDLVTGYEKRQLFIRQDDFTVTQVDFFQRRTSKLLKRLTISKLVEPEGDLRKMENFDKDHITQITTLELSTAPESVPDGIFEHRFITSKRHMR